jgi:hypothetical protein
MSGWEPYFLCLVGGLLVGHGAGSLWSKGYRAEYLCAAIIGLIMGWWGMTL